MGSYQKFTLAFFRKRLQEGAYENATGANRAIGKTRELSDPEKESARTLVRKYFGDDSKPPAKKAAKKVAKKAAVKAASKPAKKLAKKVDKKAAKKEAKVAKVVKKIVAKATKKATGKVAAAPRGKKSAKKAAPPAASKAEEPAPAARKAPAKPVTKEQQNIRLIELMGSVVNTLSTAMKSMESAKDLFPKDELEAGVKSAGSSMSKAVRIIDGALTPMDNAPASKSSATAGKSGKGAAPKKVPEVAEVEDDSEEDSSEDGSDNS